MSTMWLTGTIILADPARRDDRPGGPISQGARRDDRPGGPSGRGARQDDRPGELGPPG